MERFPIERMVIDASVAVKWFVTEKDTDIALKMRDAYLNGVIYVISPQLIYYEVANALRFHPHYKLSNSELINAIRMLKDMQIATEPTFEMWLQSFEISKMAGISIMIRYIYLWR